MSRMIIIDQQACTGCRQCELVCSVKHTGTADPARARVSLIRWEADGFYLPMLCQQCLEPACAAVCPKGALSREQGLGLVVIDRDKCIGCKMCVMACPFGAMGVDEKEGKVVKCDLCDGEPTCVSFCEAGALKYEDAETAHLAKKRASAARFSRLMGA
ncbi:MAG: 4Fe-4S dicluster domain-containing protein [Deltaproteobacteria bacterium]|nr:4Fe-4S dicluster domain-containing protein [Deltaproteobacteria bacterium]